MGVPSFFMWLINNFGLKNIIKTNIKIQPMTFYIDANCAFHPICFDTLAYHQTNKLTDPVKLEQDMFANIIKYLDKLIENVNPIDTVFIAVDGVAPMAKVQQQRKRRYKSVIEQQVKLDIKKKYGVTDSINWNNIVITPGTLFMEKLHKCLKKYISKKKDKRTYIYSSYHQLGEGEHKILSHIKKNISDNTIVIYGLDADLIFLALASQKNNIYLYRENNQLKEIFKSINAEFAYVNIDYLKHKYYEEIDYIIKQKTNLDLIESNIINDFIVLCFFIGNDFIPNIPSISINTGGLNIILDIYIKLLCNTHSYLLNNDFSLNIIFFKEFLNELRLNEHKELIKIYNKLGTRHRKCPTDIKTEYEQEIWKLENMILIHNEDELDLSLGTLELIKTKYYHYYLGFNDYYNDSVKQLCDLYMKSFIWNIQYYFSTCSDYNWYYPYSVAPFISDIYEYLDNCDISLHKNDNIFLTPLKQLLLVLPKEYSNYLPLSIQNIIKTHNKYNYIYQQNTLLDTINKTVYWKCNPYLIPINIELVNLIYNKTKLTENEEELNNLEI